jgi:hypothetical protein
MAALKLDKLKEIIKKAYVAGYNGCMDLADEFADEMLVVVQQEVTMARATEGEWRVYPVEELKNKPFGTVFEHSRLGQCWIDGDVEKVKCMSFKNGDRYFFGQNIEPWTEPLRETGNKDA